MISDVLSSTTWIKSTTPIQIIAAVADWIMASLKYDQIPIPWTCEYISLQGTEECGAMLS